MLTLGLEIDTRLIGYLRLQNATPSSPVTLFPYFGII